MIYAKYTLVSSNLVYIVDLSFLLWPGSHVEMQFAKIDL